MLPDTIDRLGEINPDDPNDRAIIVAEYRLVRNTGQQMRLRYATCKTLGEEQQAQAAMQTVERSLVRLGELAEQFPWLEDELRTKHTPNGHQSTKDAVGDARRQAVDEHIAHIR